MIHENHSKFFALSHLVIRLKSQPLHPKMGAYNEGDNESMARATTAQLETSSRQTAYRRCFDLRLFSCTIPVRLLTWRLRHCLNLKAAGKEGVSLGPSEPMRYAPWSHSRFKLVRFTQIKVSLVLPSFLTVTTVLDLQRRLWWCLDPRTLLFKITNLIQWGMFEL